MAKHIEDEVVYHYDLYPTREDLMGETSVHARLVRYLVEVLTWLFQGQPCAIHENLNFYQTRDAEEYPLAPDIAVIKGVEDIDVPSWKVGRTGPAPQVVFEIASKETWTTDQAHKPLRYARMSVQEYLAYDPNEPLLDREATSRLTGWQFDAARQYMQKMPLRPDGSLWSVHLDSFLVPAGKYLYLSDRQGRLRLTQAQAEAQRAEQEARRAEAEKRRADAEAKRAEALAEKLRSLGIDPNEL